MDSLLATLMEYERFKRNTLSPRLAWIIIALTGLIFIGMTGAARLNSHPLDAANSFDTVARLAISEFGPEPMGCLPELNVDDI